MPKMPDFAGRPLNRWALDDLNGLAAQQRHDPPKIRTLINWMQANDVTSMADLDDDYVIDVCKRLNLTTVFASATDVLLGSKPPTIIEGTADEVDDEPEPPGPGSTSPSDV